MTAVGTHATDTQLLSEVEEALGRALETHPLAPRLREAMRYATLGGGKRVRPVLTLRACEAVGGRRADAVPAAIALEMIHCFSLVHDDLPALDNDDLRRGRPTTHKAHGEALAILAGDALTSVAVEIALDSPLRPAEIARELASATTAMISGQVYDTLGGFPGTPDAGQRLRLIHDHKTGALIRCACRMGARCGTPDESRFEALSTYGDAMGLMFQVVDDILDETQSTEHLGKASGKDRDAGKLTYPGVFGIEESRRHVAKLLETALDALRPLGEAADPLRAMASALATRTR
jgi:geranylgeranyl diphosphate synthase type II